MTAVVVDQIESISELPWWVWAKSLRIVGHLIN
jgi:hypothetical protein